MSDAAETLLSLYSSINAVPGPSKPLDDIFGLEVLEYVRCSSCDRMSHRQQYVQVCTADWSLSRSAKPASAVRLRAKEQPRYSCILQLAAMLHTQAPCLSWMQSIGVISAAQAGSRHRDSRGHAPMLNLHPTDLNFSPHT